MVTQSTDCEFCKSLMGMPTVIVRYRGGTRRTYRAVLIPYGLVSVPDAERHPEIVRRAREVLP
jgi:hypothetical protein